MTNEDADRMTEAGIKFVFGAVFLGVLALVCVAVVTWAWRIVF